MKIISFNVNGIRAIAGKSFIEDMKRLDPTIICLQETKATCTQVMETLSPLSGYTVYANEADRVLPQLSPARTTLLKCPSSFLFSC